MATLKRLTEKQIEAVSRFLGVHGIDARRMRQGEWDEEGYNYLVVTDTGTPIYDPMGRIRRERREWPSRKVYEDLMVLMAGGTLEPKKAAPKKTTAKKAPATKKGETE